jgi:tetratricopeptide (TPR) repeat protein
MSKGAAPRRPRQAPPAPRPAAPQEITRRDVLVQAAIVFAVAIAARGLHFWAMRNSVFFEVLVCDGLTYDAWGRRLADGDWIGNEVFYQTPLYPYFLGLTYALVGHSLWAVRLIQALLGAIACMFAARAGSAWFSHRVGWVSGLLLAVYPPAIFFDGIFQKASLDLFFMTGILWATGAAQLRPRLGTFAVAGLLLGGMTLNRENAVLLVPLLLVWALWLSWTERPVLRVKRCAALLLGLAAVLLPVGWRNYYVGGQFLLTTSQMGPNFYIGNHVGASGLYEPLRPGRGDPMFESLDARLLAEQAEGRKLSASEVSNYWMRRSWQDISTDPAGWLGLLARKWFLTWNTLEIIDAESIRTHQNESPPLRALGWLWHFGVLVPLAVAGVWLTRKRWRELWLLYAILLTFAFAVALFFVFGRYRYPLVPLAMLLAAGGIVEAASLWARRATEKSRELAIAAGAALIAAVFCNWPLPGLYNDEVSYITTATTLMDNQRADNALALLEKALQYNPESVDALCNSGVAAVSLRRFEDAERFYARALRINPKFALAHHGLAEVYRQQGKLDDARREWQQALELDPQLAVSYRAMGSAEVAAGNPNRAIPLLLKSLEFEPQSVMARVELATAYVAVGKPELAREQLTQLVGKWPRVREANNLAWILAASPDPALRNAEEALRLAQFACEATENKMPDLLDTLAVAQANAGDFAAAERSNQAAKRLASEAGNQALLAELQKRDALYAAKQPYRDPQLAPGKGQD